MSDETVRVRRSDMLREAIRSRVGRIRPAARAASQGDCGGERIDHVVRSAAHAQLTPTLTALTTNRRPARKPQISLAFGPQESNGRDVLRIDPPIG